VPALIEVVLEEIDGDLRITLSTEADRLTALESAGSGVVGSLIGSIIQDAHSDIMGIINELIARTN
jgi:hypothetical protein